MWQQPTADESSCAVHLCRSSCPAPPPLRSLRSPRCRQYLPPPSFQRTCPRCRQARRTVVSDGDSLIESVVPDDKRKARFVKEQTHPPLLAFFQRIFDVGAEYFHARHSNHSLDDDAATTPSKTCIGGGKLLLSEGLTRRRVQARGRT